MRSDLRQAVDQEDPDAARLAGGLEDEGAVRHAPVSAGVTRRVEYTSHQNYIPKQSEVF